MNERIHELAKRAEFEYENYKDIWFLEGFNPSCNEELKRFAELIVEECVNLMENQREHYYSKVLGQQSAEHYDRVISKGDAFDEAANIIRKHFGVE